RSNRTRSRPPGSPPSFMLAATPWPASARPTPGLPARGRVHTAVPLAHPDDKATLHARFQCGVDHARTTGGIPESRLSKTERIDREARPQGRVTHAAIVLVLH